MTGITAFAEIAALAGDPARAAMLHALIDGRALAAAELARAGGIAPQTASGHLGRLTEAGLLAVARQGRHRYYRLASPAVARMMESIMQVEADRAAPRRPVVVGPRDAALRFARTCYDHLAGRIAVGLTDALVAEGHVELTADSGIVTPTGLALFGRAGIALDPARPGRARMLCRPCLDWSERRPHLAGALGAAICRHCVAKDWVRRGPALRAVTVTPLGRRMLRDTFGLDFAAAPD